MLGLAVGLGIRAIYRGYTNWRYGKMDKSDENGSR